MFETEDLLPRMAPKPSSANPMGGSEPIVRPQVPEVSILFGQQQGGNVQSQQQSGGQQAQQTTSYAAWKKQMLPKVTFPAELAQEIPTREPLNNTPRSNLYPMRATAASMAPMSVNGNSNGFMVSSAASMAPMSVNGNSNGFIGNNAPPFVSAANSNQNGYVGNDVRVANPASYRRSLDNCTYQPTQQPQQQTAYRKSVEMTPPSNQTCSYRDVLTICAGTQTDAFTSPSSELPNAPLHLASKQDVEDLKQIVEEMRHDQLLLLQMMKTFLCSKQKPNVECKDAEVQVENDAEIVPSANGYPGPDLRQTPLPAPTNKFIQHLKQSPKVVQTPKGKPMAQSTTYRPNTPQPNRLQEYQTAVSHSSAIPAPSSTNYPQWSNQVAVVLPKPSTEKSLVMNELALKYLPNAKLAELLNDLNIACPLPQLQPIDLYTNCPSTPLRNVENFERGPSDISNASYKYLKKYRLLPEDRGEDDENENPQQQYGTERGSPGQQIQTPNAFTHQKPNSPYQQQPAGRLPLSPLARADVTTPQKNNMLDLENIRHQPKFL